MSSKIFFQDHLFEDLPVDKYDNPMVIMNVVPENIKHECELVSLDRLLRLNTKREWEKLIDRISNTSVCIIDDVPLYNEEVQPYKDFYLRAYYYYLSKFCRICYIDK